MDLTVVVEMHGERALVRVSGSIDVYAAPAFRDRLERELDAGNSNLLVDLSEVSFLDSTGLSVLVGRLKHARHDGGQLELVCPEGRVRQAFVITGLNKVFVMHDTLTEALQVGAA